jgi:hypothetical protein
MNLLAADIYVSSRNINDSMKEIYDDLNEDKSKDYMH